jgi:hypothetical protein
MLRCLCNQRYAHTLCIERRSDTAPPSWQCDNCPHLYTMEYNGLATRPTARRRCELLRPPDRALVFCVLALVSFWFAIVLLRTESVELQWWLLAVHLLGLGFYARALSLTVRPPESYLERFRNAFAAQLALLCEAGLQLLVLLPVLLALSSITAQSHRLDGWLRAVLFVTSYAVLPCAVLFAVERRVYVFVQLRAVRKSFRVERIKSAVTV